jgi:hypothetical protein
MNLIGRKMQYIFTAFLLLGLFSCVPEIHLRHLAKLRTGMSPDEPPRVMGVHPRGVTQWSLAKTGEKIIVQSYVFSAGGEPGSTYFLAYRNGSLIFWGYPHEFARSSDPFIRGIGKEALRRHVK